MEVSGGQQHLYHHLAKGLAKRCSNGYRMSEGPSVVHGAYSIGFSTYTDVYADAEASTSAEEVGLDACRECYGYGDSVVCFNYVHYVCAVSYRFSAKLYVNGSPAGGFGDEGVFTHVSSGSGWY